MNRESWVISKHPANRGLIRALHRSRSRCPYSKPSTCDCSESTIRATGLHLRPYPICGHPYLLHPALRCHPSPAPLHAAYRRRRRRSWSARHRSRMRSRSPRGARAATCTRGNAWRLACEGHEPLAYVGLVQTYQRCQFIEVEQEQSI